METRLLNISRSTNATDLVEPILESSHEVLSLSCIFVILERPDFSLTALEFYATSSFQTLITLLVTCPKLWIYIFSKVHISVSKCAKFQFATIFQWEIKPGWKFWKNVFFADVFLQKHNVWNTQISWKWKSGQRSVISKKFKYSTNACLKLQLSKVAGFFYYFCFFSL